MQRDCLQQRVMSNERFVHHLIVLVFTKTKMMIRACQHTRNTASASRKAGGEVAISGKPPRLPYI